MKDWVKTSIIVILFMILCLFFILSIKTMQYEEIIDCWNGEQMKVPNGKYELGDKNYCLIVISDSGLF